MDVQQLIDDCRRALAEASAERAVREIVGHATSDYRSVERALNTPPAAGIEKLYVADDLTIINVVWAPGMTIMPHNHNMWAVIGVYSGREDNIFWKPADRENGEQIEALRARSLGPGDVAPLGRSVIHSVTNPTSKYTGAIHIYGGDFFEQKRSEWDPETLRERPYDVARNMQMFAEGR